MMHDNTAAREHKNRGPYEEEDLYPDAVLEGMEYDNDEPSCSAKPSVAQLVDPLLDVVIEQQEAGSSSYIAKLEVPNAFFGLIIGTRGATKTRIENETKTRLLIPKISSAALHLLSPCLRTKKVIGCFTPCVSCQRALHVSHPGRQEERIVTCPPFPESVVEGDLKWEKKVGDNVAADDVVAEIETDKTSIPVPAPVAGVITELIAKDGAPVKSGAPLFKIRGSGGAAVPPPAPAKKATTPAPAKVGSVSPESTVKKGGSEAKEMIAVCPAFPESITEGELKWEKKVGDSVKADDVVAEIETDKTALPVPAPITGIITELVARDGDTVKAGQPLFKIKGATGGTPAASTPAPSEVPAKAAAPPAPKKKGAAAPPAAKKAAPPPAPPPARELGVPSPGVSGLYTKLPPSDPTKEIRGTRTEVRVKMNRMRMRTGERLKEAQNTTAMLTTFNEVDLGSLVEFRKMHMAAFEKQHKVKLGFMSAFCKAAAYALQDQPVINAVIEGTDIIYRDYVDISVAVATPKGLVVPVLRNVESMNFADIEKGIIDLATKARQNKLAIEDMQGGTFTVTNGGVFGSLFATPIINPPQSAIFGMYGVKERAVVIKGKIVARPMMYVALTYDHRLIDGREAALFLVKIKQVIEDLRIMLNPTAMIIPIRCFTCGKVIGNKWEAYLGLLQADYTEGDALDALNLKRYCCRRMLLGHVDLIEKLLNYAPLEK
ncbi:unnamed protein product [Cyprideis torosa]|uniref:DNA-directed RNA polymerases I, II, and III subunit RPABC5 n=1 Tax=Cyprideis torosa TaxID=163714 RepID=A0A7R8W8A5_9CRUS|nr:unnamed protein product [Cyprideis torosa]CAG0883004.1 unnamed protein product [Cyprideis torosa]